MGLFGKLFGTNKTQRSGIEQSMSPDPPNTSSAAKDSTMDQGMEHSRSASTSTLVKDPVCGMDVDPDSAAGKSEFQGQTYHFCSPNCKMDFDKDPARYAEKPASSGQSRSHGCC